MKRSAICAAFSVLLAAPLLMVSTVRAEAAVDIGADVSLGFRVGEADVNVFYDSLAPYGDWVDTGRYGLCWTPRLVQHDWRPYYYGHWVYTDYGWTWVSDEEWGWAPYHYGRWAFDPAYGWVWVPGSVWAPAWVAWRWGDGYAGWAPLPPEADPAMGPADFGIDPLSFVFVPDRYIAEPVLVERYVPPARNVTIVRVTQNVTNYRVVNNQVVNHGVPVEQVERVAGRAVPRVRVAEQAAPARTQVRGNEVAIYKPAVPKASATTRPRTATQPRPPETTQHPPATAPRPSAATQRPPAAAPPSTTDPAELKRKQAEEQQALQAKEAQEREQLRRTHEQEKAAPPPNVSQQQLEKQHQEEQRAQAEHEQRQKQALEERQARERQAAQQQRQGHPQAQNEKQKNDKQKNEKQKDDKEKKKPEDKQ